MPVDKKRVIQRLKALFPKANLSQKRLDEFADRLSQKPADDADDAAIDAVITDANTFIDFEGVAKEDDRIRTELAKQNQNPPGTPPAGTPPAGTPPTGTHPTDPNPEDAPKWAQDLFKEIKDLKDGKLADTRRQQAAEVFSKSEKFSKIPDQAKQFWMERIDINSEIPFEDQLKTLEQTYDLTVQAAIDSTSYHGPAGSGNPSTEVNEAIIDDILGTGQQN